MRKFTTFCERYHVPDPFPVTEFLLCSFAASMAEGGLAPQTVKSYLAAIRNTQLSLGLPDPRERSSLPVLKRVLAGISRSCLGRGQPSRVRLPVTAVLLRRIKEELQLTPKSEYCGPFAARPSSASSGWGNCCGHRRLTLTPGCTSHGVTWPSTTPRNRGCSGSASASPRLINLAEVWTLSSARRAVTFARWPQSWATCQLGETSRTHSS